MTLDIEFIENEKELTANFSENEQRINAEFDSVIAVGVDPEVVYNEGYEAGQKAEYDRFWDIFQDYGKRPYYTYAFAYTWTDDIYNPKYPITSEAMIYIMYLSSITDTKVDIISDDLSYAFNQAKKLKTIRKLIVKETTKYTSAFYGCTELENIAFEGVIGEAISFANSPLLSAESVQNIIDHLGTVATATKITFNNTVKLKLTEEQYLQIAAKNWQVG
jgi:hypothetical protein